MDLIFIYIVGIYVFICIASAVGSLNRDFDANIMQRIAMGLLALWAVWRIILIWDYGWSYPHEPVMVTALGIYAVGTITKMIHYRRCK